MAPSNATNLNLTMYCSTFPPIPRNEIFRESIIKHLRDSFSLENRIIVVEGIPSSGKTVLLSQFSRYFCNNTFSFFIGNDYWSSTVFRFLSDMCDQMKHLYEAGKLSKEDITSLSETDLKILFTKFYSSLAKDARKGKGPFYLVIDGIDSIPSSYGEESILKLLPIGNVEGIYVLLSSTKGSKYDFSYTPWPIQGFSPEETEIYLSNYMSNDESRKIYDASDGLPGYVAEVRRQLENGVDKNLLLLNPPSGFNNLLENEWSRLNLQDDITLNILALLAFSAEKLNLDKVSNILNIEIEKIKMLLTPIHFIRINSDNEIILVDIYRSFISAKLEKKKNYINQLLINFYESHSDNRSLTFLPTLYSDADKFDALVNLINANSTIDSLGYTKQVSLVKRNLRILSEMAFKKKDWQRLSWSALAESSFINIISSSPVLRNEISALLSLGNDDEALSLAYSCLLPEDRLGLLVNVCAYLNKKNINYPDGLLKSIEDTVNLIDNTLEFTPEISDKLIDICAELFPIQANLAVKLLERLKQVIGNLNNRQDLMGFLLSKLFSKLGNYTESLDNNQFLFENESIREFVRAASSVNGISAELVIEQASQLSDTSTKIYYLLLWCNSNSKDKNAYKVIKYALKIINENTDYTPSQRHLRQLASILKYCDNIDIIKELVKEFDILKETALSSPKDEYARLNLVLASLEKKWSNDSALIRLYDVYDKLDKVNEYDTRCLVLIRILQSLKDIAPEDKQLEEDIKKQLSSEFIKCLNNSASQYNICKRLIMATARYDINLADSFVEKLNREIRRNLSYADILKVYTENNPEYLDFTIIGNILNKITNTKYRDYVLVQILRRFSMTKDSLSLDINKKLRFLSEALNIKSSIGKSLALSYYISWIGDSDLEKCETLFLKMFDAIKTIDPLFEKIKIGFEIATILANKHQIFAQKIYEYTVQERLNSILSEERLCQLYIDTCRIVIHIISDLIKSHDNIERNVELVIRIISNIPSASHKSLLLCDLSLRCLLAGRKDLFENIARKCLVNIDEIYDKAALENIIIYISPMLYEYSSEILQEKLEMLQDEEKDIAFEQIVRYLISKRTPEEPVELIKMRRRVDIVEVNKICEIIRNMNDDALIYSSIRWLINLITEDIPGNKVQALFNERRNLRIAENIISIINTKLPDKNNIQHEGYKIICMACICKLRDAATGTTPYRASEHWKKICPSWDELLKASLSISNASDKTLVLSVCGELSRYNEIISNDILKNAENSIEEIRNNFDRSERFYVVAEAYKKISNNNAAQYLISEAVKIAQLCSENEGREQLMSSIIELAHSIDPSLASNIANKIDNYNDRSIIQDNVTVLNLHGDPTKLDQTSKDCIKRILGYLCNKLYTSLCSGRGIIYHDEVVAKYIYQALGQDFETLKEAISWWVENNIIGHKNSNLETLFFGILDILEMIIRIGEVLNQTSATNSGRSIYQILSTNILTFSVGEEDNFYLTINEWLRNNVKTYLKIYDPYYREKDLELIKILPNDVRVQIISAAKESELENKDLREQYTSRWSYVCDNNPPETHIYIFSTSSGNTPLHNRYIITDELGLELGTSFNGFGKKISTIRYLNNEEKGQIEKDIIDSFIATPPIMYFGERLRMRTFTL